MARRSLQARLGNDYRIVEEGLGGRTVSTESWAQPHRNGRELRRPLLESHAPLDWVIIMLGTNDCAPMHHLGVAEISFGVTNMLWEIAKSAAGPGACGARFFDAATVVPPSPNDGVHPDAAGPSTW